MSSASHRKKPDVTVLLDEKSLKLLRRSFYITAVISRVLGGEYTSVEALQASDEIRSTTDEKFGQDSYTDWN